MNVGQRVSYRWDGQVRHGTIIEEGYTGVRGTRYLKIRNDASGLIIHILPQQIINS